jgi:ATP-binding cassette subfamily B protein
MPGCGRALERETAEAAVIIVGQRVATIADADKIIVLEHGEIVGCGTHEELLANCPTYAEIVDSQLSAERPPHDKGEGAKTTTCPSGEL